MEWFMKLKFMSLLSVILSTIQMKMNKMKTDIQSKEKDFKNIILCYQQYDKTILKYEKFSLRIILLPQDLRISINAWISIIDPRKRNDQLILIN